jgi:glycosyltransferase involved in cell wall biosynthesis
MTMSVTAVEYDVREQPATALPLVLHARVVTGEGGGPDKTILNSPRFLPPLGYRSICAYMRPPGDRGFERIRQRADESQAALVELDDRGPFDFGLIKRFAKLCRDERVAIWHGHDYKSNLLGLLVRRQWPMRLVTTVHGWVKFTWKTPLYYAIDRLCLPRYERVICVSDDLAEQCRAAGVKAERCVRIDNAIDTEQFRRTLSPQQARRAVGLPPERFLIGAVGRLSREKGFDVLIRAVAQLLRDGKDIGLAIAGEGDARRELESQIAEMGVGDRVSLLGFRSDTVRLFQAFDVFALSSIREGLPNVVLEAMALEVPVVATRVAGVPALIRDGSDGLLIEAGDMGSLAQALARLHANQSLRNTLAANARATIESRYSFARRMQRVANVYDSLFQTRSSESQP